MERPWINSSQRLHRESADQGKRCPGASVQPPVSADDVVGSALPTMRRAEDRLRDPILAPEARRLLEIALIETRRAILAAEPGLTLKRAEVIQLALEDLDAAAPPGQASSR
ncbi:hypothetical protein [Haloechinothrix salitolerans]|uniref:ANTAR domain-containing protein n=1 Tax=Haloechinothrix salitolerans TaxID=926830 RepID=A0ABW2C363_9PSEU